ncbi:MAG: pyridoxal 5'-phosphate synthase glutaminase subunit PdxT [Candidatus Bipolaricaulota bacterium]|nr:pyridoxal 5'-phosphate synthase glutaminase subunit PdxT [Candidatus Bipolaricaulota bacterium]
MTVGVLAVQGDVREHVRVLERLGVAVRPVLRPEHLKGLAGIVLPGGESTAMWRLMGPTGLGDALRRELREGLPALGTCAGMILLAREITNWPERYLGVLDIAVERNATGRQVDSFETTLSADGLGELPAVFIRAPLVRRTGPGVTVLARWGEAPVLVREGRVLGASFHPELTGDTRVHGLFLELCKERR